MSWSVDTQDHETCVQVNHATGSDFLSELVALELSLCDQHVRSITLAFDADTAVPADRLQRLDYRRLDERRYVKDLPRRRSVRFSITEKCNYRCFFCHEEGLEMGVVRDAAEDAQLFSVFDQLKALNYDDFTFTGGEPLLQWKKILRCLQYMERIGYLPDIKIVSNGKALRQEFVSQLNAYPGKLRFNISMHSLESDNYRQIIHNFNTSATRQGDELERVKQNLTLLREAGIPFKLNFVLLKGINTDPDEIEKICAYALQAGAYRVKFLELMITKELKHLYRYFYRLQALKDQLGDQLAFLQQGQRRSVYRYRDTPLEIELQSCTCSRGCNVCALNRDVNFTAELRYFPCFLDPGSHTDLTTTTLSEATAIGGDYIAAMARRFGDHSPIIIRDQYLTNREVFFYYEIAPEDIDGLLQSYQPDTRLDLERHRHLTEYYFSDGSDNFAAFEHVHKLAVNSYDHCATEIVQHHQVDDRGSGRIETLFFSQGRTVPSVADYAQELAGGGFEQVLEAQWEIDYFATSPNQQDGLSISIGRTPTRTTALLRCSQPMTAASCPLKPLTQPVAAWLSAARAA